MGIDFSKIAMQSAREYKITAIQSEIERVGGMQNITITECLTNKDRDGLLVMKLLTDNKHNVGRYKIRVLKDMWGKPVNPGDKVEWKFERKLRDMFGKKINNRQFREYVRRGEKHLVEIWHDAIVDDKGCIDVAFDDAAILLGTRGVSYVSGQPITSMRETARNITRDNYDKEYANVVGRQHFWLYSEAPPEVYDALPSLKKTRKTKVEKEDKLFSIE